MLSISPPIHRVGHANYYIELAKQDYYTASGNEPGHWFGRGAERLGLSGTVRSEPYENLLWGRSPNGLRRLVQNADDERRQTAWDLTLSAPKSMSVMWALAPHELRQQIETAHRKAVETTLTFLERTTGLTRRGKAGARFEPADLVFATFLHNTSRELDPNIHTHCLLINLAVRKDGTTGALWSREFFRAKMAAGAMYQVQLAAELRQGPGFAVVPDRIGFQIQEVPRDLCRTFSKRRQTIEAELQKQGAQDAVTIKKVTLQTRPKKITVHPAKLRQTWRKTAERFSWNTARVLSLQHKSPLNLCTKADLEQRFHQEMAKLPKQKQTPGRVRGLAAALAVEMHADADTFCPLLRYVPTRQKQDFRLVALAQATASSERPQLAFPQPQALANKAADTRHLEPDHPNTSHAQGSNPGASEPSLARTSQAPQHEHSQPVAPNPHSQDHASSHDHAASRPRTEKANRHQQTRSEPQSEATQRDRRETFESAQHQSSRKQEQASKAEQADPRSHASGSNERSGGPHRKQHTFQNAQDQASAEREGGPKASRADQATHGPRPSNSFSTHYHDRERQNRNAEIIDRLDPRNSQTPEAKKRLFFAWRDFMASMQSLDILIPPVTTSRLQASRNAQFRRAFTLKEGQIPPSKRTRQRLTYHAVKYACYAKADFSSLYETLFFLDVRAAAEQNKSKEKSQKEGTKFRSRPAWQRQPNPKKDQRSQTEKNAEMLEKLDPRNTWTQEDRRALFHAWEDAMGFGTAAKLISPYPSQTSRLQAKRNREFRRVFQEKARRIPSADQTRDALTWNAVNLACHFKADVRSLYEVLSTMRPAAELGLIHTEWKSLFPNAPVGLLRRIKLPAVVVQPKRHGKWGRILWRVGLPLGEFRIQKRRLFPKAPSWNPVHNLWVPAPWLTRKPKNYSAPLHDLNATKKEEEKDQTQTHSH
jgi:conjugative relaxase-like TrwC/TraI family protein